MHAHAVTQRFLDVAKPKHASIFSRGSRDVLPMRLKTKAKAGVISISWCLASRAPLRRFCQCCKTEAANVAKLKQGSVIKISWAPKASSMLKPYQHHQHQLALCRLMQCCKPEQASITNIGGDRACCDASPMLRQHGRASSASAGPVQAHVMSEANTAEHPEHQLPPCGLTLRFVTAIINTGEHHQHQLAP